MIRVCLGDDRTRPLSLSAAKANTGHSEAPSGMVGLLRAQQQLVGSTAKGNAKQRVLNPLIGQQLGSVADRILMSNQELRLSETDTCGVSSFGWFFLPVWNLPRAFPVLMSLRWRRLRADAGDVEPQGFTLDAARTADALLPRTALRGGPNAGQSLRGSKTSSLYLQGYFSLDLLQDWWRLRSFPFSCSRHWFSE